MTLRNPLRIATFVMTLSLPLLSGCTPPMSMSFDEFDQTPGQGWRALAEDAQYAQAGRLIDEYRIEHPQLDTTKRAALAFHAGQMYAYAGENARAITRFRAAILPNEPATFPIRWNAYVRATLAFFEGDKQELLLQRHIIAHGPRLRGRHTNLDVVDQLIEHFGKPYPTAYEARVWRQLPASTRKKILNAPTQPEPRRQP